MSTTRDQDATFGTEFLDRILSWISSHLTPEQVFQTGDLAAWAEDNGWTKEE